MTSSGIERRCALALVATLAACGADEPPSSGFAASEPSPNADTASATERVDEPERSPTHPEPPIDPVRQRMLDGGGFRAGSSLEEATGQCSRLSGNIRRVADHVVVCDLPAPPDVRLSLFRDDARVGRVTISERADDVADLLERFADISTTLAERYGAPASQGSPSRCASTDADVLRSCLPGLDPVRHDWDVADPAAGTAGHGNQERLASEGLENLGVILDRTGESSDAGWRVAVQRTADGFADSLFGDLF